MTLPTIAISLMAVISAVSGLNMALPNIAVELHATQTQLTWIVDIYTVLFSGLLLLAGAIGDKYGRQRILLAGLLVFGVAATLAIFATSPGELMVVRALMGIGAAGIMPTTLSVITTSFPEEERSRAVSVWVGITIGGAVLGLFVTAFLLRYFSWSSFFTMNAILSVIAFFMTLRYVIDSRDSGKPLDWTGGLCSILGVTGLVYGIIQGSDKGFFKADTLTAFVVGALGILSFIFWELRSKHPLLDPRYFKNRGFTTGSLSITLQFFAQFGFLFVAMQYLQYVAGLTPWQSAIRLLPMPFIAIPASRAAEKLSHRFSQKSLGATGLVVFSVAMFIFANLKVDFNYWYFLSGLVCFGTGIAFSAQPATTAITGSLPMEKQGVASAVNDTSREIGSAFGIAIIGAALNSAYKNSIHPYVAHLPAALAKNVEAGVAFTQVKAPSGFESQWSALVTAGKLAFMKGVHSSLIIATVASLFGAIFVAIYAPSKKEERAAKLIADGNA
jgi:EmrB/QacA subfamily drug resistance transporter